MNDDRTDEYRSVSWEELWTLSPEPAPTDNRPTPKATGPRTISFLETTDEPLLEESALAGLFGALDSQLRLEMVSLLLAGPARTSDIARELELKPHHASHHLGLLERANVVQVARRGRNRIYALHPDMEALLRMASELMSTKQS